ncbi:16415_t:CDS:2, partial [Racocetra fulgida]
MKKKKVNHLAKFTELKKAMDIWLRRVLSQNGILTDGILQCRLKRKKILLLVDGATSHSNNDKLTHVKLHFLLPHTTPYLQPCDARIIHSFKAHYRKLYLQSIIDAINANKEISPLISWTQLGNMQIKNQLIKNLISEIQSNYMRVMTVNDYIRVDDTLKIEEVVLDEDAIIKEILPQSNPNSDDNESDIEIKKFPYSVDLKQCRLLIQYVEQQEP